VTTGEHPAVQPLINMQLCSGILCAEACAPGGGGLRR
jgi:hypothetical protein